jgi:hypothetical protein
MRALAYFVTIILTNNERQKIANYFAENVKPPTAAFRVKTRGAKRPNTVSTAITMVFKALHFFVNRTNAAVAGGTLKINFPFTDDCESEVHSPFHVPSS